jgi:hypothetical protein
MTPNRSLALSIALQKVIRTDLLQLISEDFPFDVVDAYRNKSRDQKRDRIYNDENTLLTMLVSALQQDKSLQQSVAIFKRVFESRSEAVRKLEADQLNEVKQEQMIAGRKRGRPPLYHSKLAKSKTQTVSANTAAYTKARQRLDYELVKQIFDHSKNFGALQQLQWHGMDTYNTDGTYIQMQDTKELASKFFVKENDNAYPQALLQAIVRQGSGQISCFALGTRHQSELELLQSLISQLPSNSLLLADDLYNSYAIFALLQHQQCHLIVPGKRMRNYKVVKELSVGDQLVELAVGKIPAWWKQNWTLPSRLTMRRIEYLSPFDGQTVYVLYTTLTDAGINTTDIILKYNSRWDIEITIREIKTLMDVNIVRSKGEDMVLKEVTVALTAYNMIRKLIAKSVEQTEFSPQKDIIKEFFALHKKLLIDKKGRVYKRWSPGRHGEAAAAD